MEDRYLDTLAIDIEPSDCPTDKFLYYTNQFCIMFFPIEISVVFFLICLFLIFRSCVMLRRTTRRAGRIKRLQATDAPDASFNIFTYQTLCIANLLLFFLIISYVYQGLQFIILDKYGSFFLEPKFRTCQSRGEEKIYRWP